MNAMLMLSHVMLQCACDKCSKEGVTPTDYMLPIVYPALDTGAAIVRHEGEWCIAIVGGESGSDSGPYVVYSLLSPDCALTMAEALLSFAKLVKEKRAEASKRRRPRRKGRPDLKIV